MCAGEPKGEGQEFDINENTSKKKQMKRVERRSSLRFPDNPFIQISAGGLLWRRR